MSKNSASSFPRCQMSKLASAMALAFGSRSKQNKHGFGKYSPVALGVVVMSMGFASAASADADNDGISDSDELTAHTNNLFCYGNNLFTDFDNGTFGFASGAEGETPANDPYPGVWTGGIYDEFYSIGFGDYSYIANAVTPRNGAQHPNAVDPVYGVTGRFFASDPDTSTPTANTTMNNLVIGATYEFAVWGANSEPGGNVNEIDVFADGVQILASGPLSTNANQLEWARYTGTMVAQAATSTITFASTKTGSSGNDFYMDNIEFCLMAPDFDADGIPDVEDLDSDDDGLLDAIEGAVDTDNDGMPDYIDLDSDGDGILDEDEIIATAPVATDDSASVVADTNATISLADNVSDADADADISTIDLNPAISGVQSSLNTAEGDWSVDAAGVVTFDPAPAFEGTASIPYTVTDASGLESNSANVSVTVAGAPPIASADSASVLADTIANIDLSDNITDANSDADITTIDLDPATPGVQSALTTADGDWSVNSAGMVTFDPASAFEGTASIPYTVDDAAGNVSAAAVITVDVEGAPPIATADSTSVLADANAVIDLADNVIDANDDLDITTIDLDPATPGVQSTLTTADGEWSVDPAGMVTFDPVPAFEGTTSVPYTVEDAAGNVSAPAVVSVTVAGAPPVATADSTSVLADTNAIVDLADNVTDANNDADIATIDLDPATSGIQNTLTTADGDWSVDPTGKVSFDPVPAFEGIASIPYTVEDVAGNVSTSAVVSVTVAGAPPLATDDAATVLTDTNAIVDLEDNITDANSDADITTIDLDPATPGIQDTLTTADGEWSVDPAGTVTFDPEPAFEGSAAITYTVEDAAGNISAPGGVIVNVGGATPIATSDATTVAADTIAAVDLTDNVSDLNNDIDLTTIDLDPTTPGIQNTLTTADGVWMVDSAGMVSFDPEPSFVGTATIAYTVADDDGNTSPAALVSVTVDGAIPLATADSASVLAATTAIIDLSDNVSDVNNDLDITTIDLDPVTPGVQSTLTTADGDWSVDPAGMVTFAPVVAFSGTTLVSYTVQDDEGNVSLPADITVTVGNADPIADSEMETIVENMTITIDVLDGDNDANNDIDSTTIDLDPATAGVQTIMPVAGEGVYEVVAGEVVFTPEAEYFGTSSVDYTVSDTAGNTSNIAAIDVTILPDSDGDSIADDDDIDDDNDGIPDLQDGANDTDGDGIIDSLDSDSDNDGITDTIEAGGSDIDGDGIIDGFTDADGDGLDDSTDVTPLPAEDTDGDGLPDFQDLDSDNDGLTDITEAGGTDVDGDGTVDGLTDINADGLDDAIAAAPLPLTNSDNDSAADYLDIDSDNDGIPDVTEAGGVDADGDGFIDGFTDANDDGLDDAIAVTALPDVDTDGDGVVDHLDIDSDNDGLTDATEAGGSDTNGDGIIDGFADADGDGLDDSANAAPLPLPDTDGDAIPDHLELDSDADQIPDSVEAGPVPNIPVDTDGDGAPDHLEIDSDNDTIPDTVEAGATPSAPVDTDGDGVADFLEPDSDNDGIPDSVEAGATPAAPVDTDGDGLLDYLEPDSDNDGIPDTYEAGATPSIPVDTDGDGTPDFLEQDSDDDGIPDTYEAGATPAAPVDTDGDGTPDFLEQDSDDDGIPDTVEAGTSPTAPVDTDGDGTPDFLELDSDDDGIVDTLEAGPNPTAPVDTDGDGTPDYQELTSDSDGDGILNSVEGTVDTDGDGIPNFLDEDSDDDGIPDAIETAIDTDTDTLPDYLDIDSDNDGISDALELADDSDADGIEDFRDLDVDNDGIYDLIEARIGLVVVNQIDTDNNGIVDFSNSYGANGMADIVETTPDSGQENYELPDIDGDGVVDYRDLDTDNDGILDTHESDHIDANLNGVIDTFGAVERTTRAANGIGLASDAGGLPRNTDADGLADFRDRDSDNDGILDVVESFGAGFDLNNDGMLDNFVDSNGDGVDDKWEAAPLVPADTDIDGLIDAQEIDADADGIRDLIESGGVDADGSGTLDGFSDDDVDGIDDAVAAVPTVVTDTDADGIPDFQELDSDGDGLSDMFETGGIDADGNGEADSAAIALKDTDGNGTPDYQEVPGGVSPVNPVNPIGLDAEILTGLSGNGCAIPDPLSHNISTAIDPVLPALGMLSIMGLALRRRLVSITRTGGES